MIIKPSYNCEKLLYTTWYDVIMIYKYIIHSLIITWLAHFKMNGNIKLQYLLITWSVLLLYNMRAEMKHQTGNDTNFRAAN